jgi:beta-hydroxylase
MFFDPVDFSFTDTLCRSWREIRAELEALTPSDFMPWPEIGLYKKGWDVFGLYAFGAKLGEQCSLCPRTTALVETIPGMTTAGFSLLRPGTHIVPHRGYTGEVLRCHLGLIVPAGCEIRVGTDVRQWREGECLVFDDTIEHEVWHRGDANRIVLLVDFRRPAPR